MPIVTHVVAVRTPGQAVRSQTLVFGGSSLRAEGTLQEEAHSPWPVPVPVRQLVGFDIGKWRASCSALITVHRDAVSLSVQCLPKDSLLGLSLPAPPGHRQL